MSTKVNNELDLTIYTKTGKLRKRKPKENRNYFTDDTQAAVLEYNSSTDSTFKSRLYSERMHYAFYKLAENIIHTFKFYYAIEEGVEELKYEVITFLLSKVHLYKEEKGRAYSYLQTIAKRYLINLNITSYKKLKEKGSLDEVDEDRSINNEMRNSEIELQMIDYMDQYIEYMEKYVDIIFKKTEEHKISLAILTLFKQRETLNNTNKKAVYIFIKEMVNGAKTTRITKVSKIMNLYYKKLYSQFNSKGYTDNSKLISVNIYNKL